MNSSSKLEPAVFSKLLDALSPDREQANAAFADLRRRLVRFFGWEGCFRPEACAHEVLNRIAAKLQAGERIQNLLPHASGVSRVVLKETLRAQAAQQPEASSDPNTIQIPEFLLEYNRGDAFTRVRNRRAMAERQSLTLDTLRTRAVRLREELE